MRPDEQFEVKFVKQDSDSRRLYSVQTSPSFFVRVEVDEEGYLRYESSSSETASEASSRSELDASELDDEAKTIQTKIRAAIKPQRKIGLEAINVRWVEKGSIIVCVELDLPYALKLLDLSERKDFKDELGLRSCVIGESHQSSATTTPVVSEMNKSFRGYSSPAIAYAVIREFAFAAWDALCVVFAESTSAWTTGARARRGQAARARLELREWLERQRRKVPGGAG